MMGYMFNIKIYFMRHSLERRITAFIESLDSALLLFTFIFFMGVAIGYAQSSTDSVASDKTKIENKTTQLTREAEDSIIARELKEFVITADKNRIEGNKIISIPSKKEKNLSYNPATLIDVMNMPGLIVKDGNISTYGGFSVAIYINGIKANITDIATFRTQDVIRVEYIRNSSDSRYSGDQDVVNFVVKEYTSGGVTNISLGQEIPNSGYYGIASKLAYKEMTYALSVDAGYSRNHFEKESGTTHYSDIFYNGTHYDDIEYKYDNDIWERNNSIKGIFSARWVGKDAIVTHTAGVAWDQNAGSGVRSSDSWTPDLFASTASNTSRDGLSISPQFTGRYKYLASGKFNIEGGWSYRYTHNNNNSLYQSLPLDPISNGIKEDVNRATLFLTPEWKVSDHVKFFLSSTWEQYWYHTQYKGSSLSLQKQQRGEAGQRLLFFWYPNNKISVDIVPGWRLDYWKVGADKFQKHCVPTVEMDFSWATSSKFRISTHVRYNNTPANASQTGDLTLQLTDLMWMKGNSMLKSQDNWMTMVQANWFPLDMFNLGGYVIWNRRSNYQNYIYEQAPADMGGIIQTYVNYGHFDQMNVGMNLNARFLKNALSLSVNPEFKYNRSSNEWGRDKGSFYLEARVAYMFRNFRAALQYDYTTEELSYTMERIKRTGDLSCSISWGTGDIYVQLMARNITNKNKQWLEYTSPHYSYSKCHTISPFKVLLSFFYTISYGKKTDQRIDTGNISTGDSGALK